MVRLATLSDTIVRFKVSLPVSSFAAFDMVPSFREDPEKYTLSHKLTTKQEETWDPLLDWFSVRIHV